MNKSCLFLLPLTAVVLFSAGCDTPARDQARFQAQQEEDRKSIPPMEAQDVFFDGHLVATLSLMSGMPTSILRLNKAPGADGAKSTEPLFAPVTAGSGNGYASGYLTDDQTVGSWNGLVNNTPPPEPTQEEYEAMLSLKAESPLPPILLRLFLKNTTGKEINVEFVDFNSQLGNFALQPEKIAIPAGKIAHPNNVISRLGLTSYDIPVTVTLRVDGKKETKVMKLHLLTPNPTPAPAN